MSSSPRKGRRSNHPYRPATSKPASSIRRRHSIAESQCSSIEAAESPERTDSRRVLVVSSQSARSKMPGSRSSQRPCVSEMSSGARGEDVEDKVPARLEQLVRGAQHEQLLVLTLHVEERAERADHELDALIDRWLAHVADPQIDELADTVLLGELPRHREHPLREVDADHGRPAAAIGTAIRPIRLQALRPAPRSDVPPRRRTRCPRQRRRSTGRRCARWSGRGPRRASVGL